MRTRFFSTARFFENTNDYIRLFKKSGRFFIQRYTPGISPNIQSFFQHGSFFQNTTECHSFIERVSFIGFKIRAVSAKHSSLFEFTVVYWRGLRAELGTKQIND